ncbi:MAG TPA: lysylphosphatidylglycerol synthase transmembrane domain-containing protein [Thermoanaerobaculia bacterium]|nr:lysylphosphatidylglycerol synthase transmembrane domain-containing protein [Thermoanaerobaculia bacterium]
MDVTQAGEQKHRSRFWPVMRVAVSAALVAWVLHRARWAEVAEAFRAADLWPVLLALALNPIGYWASVSRWRLLLRTQGVDIPFGFLVRSFLVGVFFNNLLPSTVGGDAMRAWESSRAGAGRSTAVAVVLVDRFLGLLTLMLLAGAGVLLSPRLTERVPSLYAWVLAGALGMAFIAWLLFGRSARAESLLAWGLGRFPERWRPKLDGAARALLGFRGRWPVLGKALAYSLVLQVAVVANGWLLAKALHVPIPLPYFFLIVPLAVFVMMIPVSINAIGVRENVWAFFFTAFGVANAAAAGVAVAWLDYSLVLLQALVGGVLWMAGRRARREPVGEPVAERPLEAGGAVR